MERITYVNSDDVEAVKEALNDVIQKGSYTQYLTLLPMSDVYEKLYQVENVEYDLGIELVYLFKALKDGAWFIDPRDKDIFYAKATLVSKIEGEFECSQEDLKFNGFIILDQLFGIGHELKDYGETWALTKEELENEENN